MARLERCVGGVRGKGGGVVRRIGGVRGVV